MRLVSRWMVLTACLAAASALAAPAPLSLKPPQKAPIPTRTVEIDELAVAEPKIGVELDVQNGPIELFAADSSAEERFRSACTAEVKNSQLTLTAEKLPSEPCLSLLAPLFKGDAVRIAASLPGSSVISLIEFTPPKDFVGAAAVVNVKRSDKGVWDWAEALVPAHVGRPGGDECFVRLDRWRQIQCPANRTLVMTDAFRLSVEAKLEAGPVDLVLRAQDAEAPEGAWRRLIIKQAEPPAAPVTRPPAELSDLTQRCKLEGEGLTQTTGQLFVACVDVIPTKSGAVTYLCTYKDGTSKCDLTGDVLRPGRDMLVLVWAESDARVQISMEGTPGTDSPIFKPAGAIKINKGGRPLREKPSAARSFGSRKSEKPAVLKVVAFKKPADKPVEEDFKIETTYTFETYYRWAVRLGFGVTWAPGSRELGVRTDANNQLFSDVVQGQDGGLVTTGLVAGLTWFACEVRANSGDVGVGIGARLGVIGQGSNNSARYFDSLLVGPELTLGHDFSIGVFGGVVLDERPDAGFEAGRLLPAGTSTISTHLGVAPGFSVALTFTPDFLKTVGISE